MSTTADIAADADTCPNCKGKSTYQFCERHRMQVQEAQARCQHSRPLYRAFDGYFCPDCGKYYAQGAVVARYYAPGSER